MKDFDLKWFFLGMLALYLLQRFLGILVPVRKQAAS